MALAPGVETALVVLYVPLECVGDPEGRSPAAHSSTGANRVVHRQGHMHPHRLPVHPSGAEQYVEDPRARWRIKGGIGARDDLDRAGFSAPQRVDDGGEHHATLDTCPLQERRGWGGGGGGGEEEGRPTPPRPPSTSP